MTVRFLAIVAFVASAAVRLTAQTPAEATPAPAPSAVPVPALEPQGYTYNADGRRDPFVSLVRRPTEGSGVANSPRPRGLAGLSSGELTLRGIVKGPTGFVAMAKAVDNRTYLLRAGDKLYDGVVRAVTADGIVVLQDVSDPLSPAARREVRKPLRPTQEAH